MEFEKCRRDRRISAVLVTLDANPPKSLRELAPLVNLSFSRLGHLCKAQTGTTLMKHAGSCRLQRAANLLLQTESQVKEIAYVVGYQHPSSFVRAFRRKFGVRPTDYRAIAVAANE